MKNKDNLKLKSLIIGCATSFFLGSALSAYASDTDYVATSPDKAYKQSLVHHDDSIPASVQTEKSMNATVSTDE